MRTMTHPIVERLAAAAQSSSTEICGALIGDRHQIVDAVPIANQSTRARDRFYIPAVDVMRVERAAEQDGYMVMGFYHSHPHGDAVPSITDVQNALPGYVYWIASRRGEVRAWRLRDDRSRFDEVSIATHDDR
jgi:desampylase